jgi:hypothetical protein
MTRYRFTNDGMHSILTEADRARLARADRVPVSDQARPRHVHIYLPAAAQGGARRNRTHDAAPLRRPAVRRGDQAPPEGEPGELICTVSQNGETGDWGAIDCDGNALHVVRGGDGRLEIRHSPETADQEDPDQIKLSTTGARGENPGFEQRMAAAIRPSDRAHDRGPAALRGLQALLTSHYARRP